MLYAIELFLDEGFEQKVRDLWQGLKEDNISTYLLNMGSRPHVSLGVYHDIDTADCILKLQTVCQKIKGISLRFSAIGIFTSPKPCVFLAPVVTKDLLDIHERIQTVFSDLDDTGYEVYRRGAWVPHCALDIANELSQAQAVADDVLPRFLPIKAKVIGMGLVAIKRPIEQLFEVPLL